MTNSRLACALLLIAALSTSFSCDSRVQSDAPGRSVRGARLPVLFETNTGQHPASVAFVYRASWGRLAVERHQLAFTITPPAPPTPQPGGQNATAVSSHPFVQLVLKLPKSPNAREAVGVGKPVAQGNVYDGRDPSRNRTGLPLYREVRYLDLLPGVELSLSDQAGRLFLEAELAAGVALDQLRFRVAGSQSVEVDGRGRLSLMTDLGAVQIGKPRFFARAVSGGVERELKGSWVVENGTVGLVCHGRSSGEILRVDPEVVFAGFPDTYDIFSVQAMHLAIEGTDRAFLAVTTLTPATQANFDTVVYSIHVPDPNEMTVDYQTALENVMQIGGMDTDDAGRVFIAGSTRTQSLPPVPGPSFQESASNSGSMMALLSLAPTTGVVDRATYIGEPDPPTGHVVNFFASDLAVAMDEDGEPIVGIGGRVGMRDEAAGYEVLGAFDYFGPEGISTSGYSGGLLDGCFVRLSPDLDEVQSMDFFGAPGQDYVTRLRSADAEFVLQGRSVRNGAFPTTAGAYQSSYESGLSLGEQGSFREDLFFRRYADDGSLEYSTLLGGPANEYTERFALHPDGRVFTSFKLREANATYPYPFVLAELSGDGSSLLGESIFADTWVALGRGRTLEALSDGTLVGVFSLTYQGTYEVSPDAFDDHFGGANEILFVIFGEDGTPEYLSFMGGYNLDTSYDIEADDAEGLWVAGITVSSDFPATFGEPVTSGLAGESVFLARIAEGPPDFTLEKESQPEFVAIGEQFVYTITVTNVSGEESPTGTLVDTLPEGLVVLALPASATLNGAQISVDVPELDDQQSHSVALTVSAPLGGDYINQVQFVVNEQIEATASSATTVLGPSEVPELLLNLDGPESVGPEQAAYFALRIRNLGEGVAENVTVVASSPGVKDVRFTGATRPEVSFSEAGDTATWEVGSLQPLALDSGRTVGLTALIGGQVDEVTLNAYATTTTLASAGDADEHHLVISGIAADLSIEALEPEVVAGLRRWPFVVSETTGATGPFGIVTVDVEMHGDLYGARYQQVRVVAPGPSPAMNPNLVDTNSDLWVAPINLDPSVGLPQTVVLLVPRSMELSEIRARIFAPAVDDMNPANDEASP